MARTRPRCPLEFRARKVELVDAGSSDGSLAHELAPAGWWAGRNIFIAVVDLEDSFVGGPVAVAATSVSKHSYIRLPGVTPEGRSLGLQPSARTRAGLPVAPTWRDAVDLNSL
jgi:hypothetical protein